MASGSPPFSKISGNSSFNVGPFIVPATDSLTSEARAAGAIAHSPIDLPLAFMSAMTSDMYRLQSTFAVFLSSPLAAASK